MSTGCAGVHGPIIIVAMSREGSPEICACRQIRKKLLPHVP